MVPEDYVHRIGRTGRAGIDGDAISLVCVDEAQLLDDIERLLGRAHPAGGRPGLRARSAHPPRADPARRPRRRAARLRTTTAPDRGTALRGGSTLCGCASPRRRRASGGAVRPHIGARSLGQGQAQGARPAGVPGPNRGGGHAPAINHGGHAPARRLEQGRPAGGRPSGGRPFEPGQSLGQRPDQADARPGRPASEPRPAPEQRPAPELRPAADRASRRRPIVAARRATRPRRLDARETDLDPAPRPSAGARTRRARRP